MRRTQRSERRHEDRYPQSIDVRMQELPELEDLALLHGINILGRTQNISHKGMCIVTSEPLRNFSVLRCEVVVSDSEVRMTTLMRVRWTRQRGQNGDGFISGLEALL